MKKLFTLLAALSLLCACGGRDSHLPAAADFGAYDEEFDKVFTEVALSGTTELHGMMVLKDGKRIYQRWDTGYGPEHLNILWSASKTFTSTAIGFAIQDGLLGLDDKVISFFPPEDLPAEPCAELQALTVRDLLIMSSGFSEDALRPVRARTTEHPVRDMLATPFFFEPGSKYKYNSGNTFLLSAIVTRVTGRTTADYLNEKLFQPLGIRRWHWDESTDGYTVGGWGLFLTTESMAKMGQFYLQKGVWNGKRLLDEAWFDEATRPQIYQYDRAGTDEATIAAMADDDWRQGYGFQLWVCTHNSYRMDGAHGQFIIVMPEKNAVVAISSHSGDYKRKLLKSVWTHIYDKL
ncbi:MAG: serine hydrolase [Bacteroidales bacterium]|nr:serine hydrolase [Bacteroidales bacterium]